MQVERSRKSRWWVIARRIAFAAILVLVCRYVWQHLAGVGELDLDFTPLGVTLAAAGAVGWILIQSLLWRVVLRMVDARVAWRHAVTQVWLPNLGKYVPGKVWAAVGRIYLCSLTGIPPARGTVGLVVENVSYILAGAIFAALALPLSAMLDRRALSQDGAPDGPLLIAVAAVVVLGLVFVHPRVWGGAARFVLRRLRRESVEPQVSYGQSLALVLGYVVSWSVLGLGMCAWVAAIVPLDAAVGLRVIGLYVIAWSLGYVSMLAPAGIGVREGIMLAGLAGRLGAEAAVAIALGLRLYFTLIDVVGAALAAAMAPGLVRRLAAMESAVREDGPPDPSSAD